jgi:hypothetical protein
LRIGSFSAISRLKAPSAPRQPHLRHAPGAQPSNQLVRPHARTRLKAARPRGARLIRRIEVRQAHQRVKLRCLRRSRQQRLAQRCGQIRMLLRSPLKPDAAPTFIQRQRFIQQLAHPRHLRNR